MVQGPLFLLFPQLRSMVPGYSKRGGGGGGGKATCKALLTTALSMHNPEVITRTNTQIIQNSCDELIYYAVIEMTE